MAEDRVPEHCRQESFSNKWGSAKAIVCSCGFATTYTLLSNDSDDSGMAHFTHMHEAHRERIGTAGGKIAKFSERENKWANNFRRLEGRLAKAFDKQRTAEGLLAEANATIARLSAPVEDSELIAAMKSAPALGDRFSRRFNRIIASRISGGAK